jgi:hypothetical protein
LRRQGYADGIGIDIQEPTAAGHAYILRLEIELSSCDQRQEFLARAAGELDRLPAGSAIEQMLADYR